jgi:hypothetical protein
MTYVLRTSAFVSLVLFSHVVRKIAFCISPFAVRLGLIGSVFRNFRDHGGGGWQSVCAPSPNISGAQEVNK